MLVKNLSSQFKPSSTFIDSESSGEKNNPESRLFELTELLGSTSKKERGFSFDSEIANNFDINNIKKARQGVKELMADAITKAKSSAIEIKENALKEGQKIGYEKGFQEAYEKGENSAKEEFIPLLKTINSLIQELSEFRTMMYPKVENEMIEMITGLTKKILQHEIETKEDSVKQMILLAINSVIEKENMVIQINPADKVHAEAFYPELKNLYSDIKNVTFEEHPGIEKGGCVIATNFGTIDARVDQLENQIDQILKLTPAVPVVKTSSESLPGKNSKTETEASSESTVSETPASKTENQVSSESTVSETPASKTENQVSSESTVSETPASETENQVSSESTVSETPASETENQVSSESTVSETPASETENQVSSESTVSETPASETENQVSSESTVSETPASETKTKSNDESTLSETPASKKLPKDTSENEG